MKLIKMIILIFISLMIFGCSTNEIKTTEGKENREESEIIEYKLNLFKYNVVCSEIQNIKQYSANGGLFLTNDGQLYRLSIGKLFSNEKNCLKVDTDIKFKRFINKSLISEDGSLYYYEEYNDGNIAKATLENGGSTDIYKKMYNKYKDIYYFGFDSDRGESIYIKKDGNKIIRIIGSGDSGFKEVVLGTIPENETIIEIYNNTIKTNNSYYVYGITNKIECDKYEDIKCNYGIIKNVSASEIYEELKYFQNGISSTHYLNAFAIDYKNNVYIES